jgi:hypothetical protein
MDLLALAIAVKAIKENGALNPFERAFVISELARAAGLGGMRRDQRPASLAAMREAVDTAVAELGAAAEKKIAERATELLSGRKIPRSVLRAEITAAGARRKRGRPSDR